MPLALTLAAAGCSTFRSGPRDAPQATASTDQSGAPAEGQLDIRRYIGPDYCPELRILDGAQLVRRYERGHEDDPDYVVWQASFGETARECLYDQQGQLTLRIGISGRIIAGPKGGAGDVTVPYKVAVVKYKEATLATEAYSLAVTIPATGSTTFSEVREIVVPSPGSDRDYIVYVGFDSGEWDLEAGALVAEKPKKPAAPPPPAVLVEKPAPKKSDPGVLPTPSGGFILSQ